MLSISRQILLRLLYLLGIFSITALPAKAQDQTAFPLQLENCGRLLIFHQPPKAVVTVGQNSTELLYALGLAHKIKGTSLWYSPVLPCFTKQDKDTLRLSQNEPTFETILAVQPDMVANHLEWAIGPRGAVGNYRQFAQFHIPVYTAPADCSAKNNYKNYDGQRTKAFSLALIYQEIAEMGAIFNVNDKAKTLIQLLKDKEKQAIFLAKKTKFKNPKVMFWYSSFKEGSPPYIAGSMGVPAYICQKLGLENIANSPNEWPQMSWEAIAQANPDFIILADMTRRRYPLDSALAKKQFLFQHPLTKRLDAVKAGRIITLDAQAMNPTIRIPYAMLSLAKMMNKF